MNEPRPESRPRPLAVALPRLLRAAGAASDGRMLILAAAGLALSWAGWYGIARAPGPDGMPSDRLGAEFRLSAIDLAGPRSWDGALALAAEPFVTLARPFARLFARGSGWAEFGLAALAALWGTIVWGVVGGAMGRIAATRLATGSRPGIGSAVRFALGRSLALIGSPLFPLLGIGFFAILAAAFGLIYWIPGGIGPKIAGALAFVPLMLGLIMALLVAGLAAGWPLMVATVATEAEDAFDAVSRSYSYVFQRPALYAALVAIAALIGAVGSVVVRLFAALVVHMAAWGLSFGAGASQVSESFGPGAPGSSSAPELHGFWLFVVRLLAHGWAYAYFFAAMVAIYAVLRRDVDGTPLDDLGGTGAEDRPFAPGPEDGAEMDTVLG